MTGNKKTRNKKVSISPSKMSSVGKITETSHGEYDASMSAVELSTPTNHNSSPLFASPSSNNRSNTNKLYIQIQKAFIEVINEWIDIDDQIYRIIQSISNLRERIYQTNQFLQTQQMKTSSSSATAVWKRYGFRQRQCYNSHEECTENNSDGRICSTLDENDLQITIDHNIQHQERMIGELRRLLPSLSIIVDKLGRRYEELYLQEGYNNVIMKLSADDCLIIYIAFAKDLYRKQMIATKIIDTSTSDQLLFLRDDTNININNRQSDHNEENPISIAYQCLKQWSYISKYSYLFPHVHIIQEITKTNSNG
jgi:hypothetical protein